MVYVKDTVDVKEERMMKSNWTDLDCDGRRMNRVIKMCETSINNLSKKDELDHDLIMAYMDRLIKASHHKSQLTDMVLGLKMIRRLAEKKYLDVIVDDKLKELQ